MSVSCLREVNAARNAGREPEKLSSTKRSLRSASVSYTHLDENNLHGLLINEMRSYDAALAALEAFLPHVDNWATCDILSPRAFKTRPCLLYTSR